MTQLARNTIILEFATEKARDAFEKRLPIAEDGSLDIGNTEQRLLSTSIAKPHPDLFSSGIHGNTPFFMRFLNAADILRRFQELAGAKLKSITMYSEETCEPISQTHSMRWQWHKGDSFIKVSELSNAFIEGMRYDDRIQCGDSTPARVMDHRIDQAFDDPNVARIEYHVL